MTAVERVEAPTPLLERRQPLGARDLRVGDVVDMPAKAVDLKHRLALGARQNPHRGVERAAGRGCPVIEVRRLTPHAPAAGLDTGRRPTARRMISPARPPTLCSSSSAAPRCTVSLRGSRTFKRRTILSANDWITEISSPSRTSFTP